MQVNKTTNDVNKSSTVELIQPKQPVDPAREAGLPKVRYYQTDKWLVGEQENASYVVSKNTLPSPLEKAFTKSEKPDPVGKTSAYNRNKFTLDEYPNFEDPTGEKSWVAINCHEMETEIADVRFETNTFVVRLWPLPKSGVYPFTKYDLLKAVDAAKWTLEMYCLPQLHGDSDRE